MYSSVFSAPPTNSVGTSSSGSVSTRTPGAHVRRAMLIERLPVDAVRKALHHQRPIVDHRQDAAARCARSSAADRPWSFRSPARTPCAGWSRRACRRRAGSAVPSFFDCSRATSCIEQRRRFARVEGDRRGASWFRDPSGYCPSVARDESGVALDPPSGRRLSRRSTCGRLSAAAPAPVHRGLTALPVVAKRAPRARRLRPPSCRRGGPDTPDAAGDPHR